MWGWIWLPKAAHTGCHTVKYSSINKPSIRCQQPPFGLFRERELWCGDLALSFRGMWKNKARGRRLPVCSTTDSGISGGFALGGSGRRAFKISIKKEKTRHEGVKNENDALKNAAYFPWTSFQKKPELSISLPPWTSQALILKMVKKLRLRFLKWKMPFACNLCKVTLMKDKEKSVSLLRQFLRPVSFLLVRITPELTGPPSSPLTKIPMEMPAFQSASNEGMGSSALEQLHLELGPQ